MILINPYAGVNFDIPNIGIAYAATLLNCKVIDLNTKPFPKNRYLKIQSDVVGISIQSRTYTQAKKIIENYKKRYPEAKLKSISGIIDIQCCYPYIDLEEKIEINIPFSDELPFPNYELFDSFPIFQKN